MRTTRNDGPLDGLTSLVSNTVSAVTAPVAPIVTEVVAPVVTQVVAPVQQAVPAVVATVTAPVVDAPVVGPAVAPVVHAVTETTTAVVAPVTDVLTGAPVSQITDPILDTVSGIPVVGGARLRPRPDLRGGDVVGVVDDTTALLGNVTNETIPPVLEALDPNLARTRRRAGEHHRACGDDDPDRDHRGGHRDDAPGHVDGSAPGRIVASERDPRRGRRHGRRRRHPLRAPTDPPPSSPPGSTVPASSSAGPGGGSGASPLRASATRTLLRSVLVSGHPGPPTTSFLRRRSPTPTSLLTDGSSRRSPGNDRSSAARAL